MSETTRWGTPKLPTPSEQLEAVNRRYKALAAEHAALKQRIEAVLQEMAQATIRESQVHWAELLRRALVGA